jgi:tetratricopeptide (TPR) repeat protein
MKAMTWLFILWFGFALPLGVRAQQSAADYLNQSGQKFKSGDHDGALADVNQAIKLDPNLARAYRQRALFKELAADLSGALIDCNQAIKLDPKDGKVFGLRGDVKKDMGDVPGALTDYSQSIALDPTNYGSYFSRALIRRDESDLSGALADFDQVIKFQPINRPEPWFARANVKSDNGDVPGALADYNQAIVLDPTRSIYYFNRARLKLNNGDPSGALDDCNQAIELDSEKAGPWFVRAAAKNLMGNSAGARADYNQAIKLDPKLADPETAKLFSDTGSDAAKSDAPAQPASAGRNGGPAPKDDIDKKIALARSLAAKGDSQRLADLVNVVLGTDGVSDTQKAQIIQIAGDRFLEGRSYEGAKMLFEITLNLPGASNLDKKHARDGIEMADGYLKLARPSQHK